MATEQQSRQAGPVAPSQGDAISIHGADLPIIEIDGQRVVTLAMVDTVHRRPEGTARKRLNDNRGRFIESEDFFVRNPDEARQMGIAAPNGLNVLTESGYLMLVKSFTDDLAWEVQRELVNNYFRPKAAAPHPLAPAQLFLQNAQLLVDIEKRQLEQAAAVARIEQRVDLVEQTQLLTARPSNAESITHVCERIGRECGLSSRIVSEVMRQSPYAPKPAGNVKNTREEAAGATYAVWWKRDVTAVFKRFAAECTTVTETQCTHPFIAGRFKMAPASSSDLFAGKASHA